MKHSTDSFDYVVASENLQIEESGTDVIAFDSRTQSFHLLNATAYGIIKLCDGSNTVEDIAIALSRSFNCADIKSIEEDVKETIDLFRRNGLVSVIVDGPGLEPTTTSAGPQDSPLFALKLAGSSMFPILLPTDKVLVKKCVLDELSVGDVIVWSEPDSFTFVAHRILSIAPDAAPPCIVTKGDSCEKPDSPVELERVVGKVIAVLRAGGLQWMRALDAGQKTKLNQDDGRYQTGQPDLRRPSFTRMQVLDLREISIESIRNIELVEQISLVLLSPQNAHVWPEVPAKDVESVVTVPESYRVYTGQPELVPEIVEFLPSPLNLVICGQIFLTAFTPEQIRATFKHLVLTGQAYVGSVEAKAALEEVTTIVTGSVSLAPHEHVRWMGASILGPEYSIKNHEQPLIAIGDLSLSPRLETTPQGIGRFNVIEVSQKRQAAVR